MPFIIFALLMVVVGFLAQNSVRSTFEKYSKQRPGRGLTGNQVAREILDSYDLQEVRIEAATSGPLSDHYDPENRVLRLSPEVGDVASISAVGIAAHEAGHALQHAEKYPALMIRTSLAPTIALGTRFISWILLAGFLGSMLGLRPIGIPTAMLGGLLYLIITFMAFITLPVEFDASARAKRLLYEHQIVSRQEMEGVSAVLNAAAWTYVVSALNAIFQLLLRRR